MAQSRSFATPIPLMDFDKDCNRPRKSPLIYIPCTGMPHQTPTAYKPGPSLLPMTLDPALHYTNNLPPQYYFCNLLHLTEQQNVYY